MKQPEVSVIIVTYNQQDSVGKAIESVLAQRCEVPFEIVIGEDGSTDATRSVCQRYAEKYPNIIRMMPAAPNKGIVLNYFDCLAACRGKYIADCAGDDCWLDRDRMQRQLDYLRREPKCVAVMSDWVIAQGESHVSSRTLEKYAPYKERIAGRRMLELALGAVANFPLLSAMMYRRDVIEEALLSDRLAVCNPEWRCEDVSVVAALAAAGDFGYESLDATMYSVGDESVSNSRSAGHLFDFYVGPAQAVASLVKKYEVAPWRIRTGLDARIKYLAGLAWAAPSAGRIEKLRALCRRWPLPLPWKVRVRLGLMRFYRR